MAIDIDVLIAYADRDNEAPKNESGWVTLYKRFLEMMLTQVLGSKPKIMLKSEYDSLTAAGLNNVGVLVAIVSSDFAQSGACLDTVEQFYKVVGTAVQPARVFKVMKSPLLLQDQPPRMRNLLAYEMFQLDAESGKAIEYTDFFSLEAERQYWMKMVDLAYDINESLMALKETAGRPEAKNLFKRKSIYLAETGHDLSVQRNIIKRELQRHGYVVLPSQTLTGNVKDLEDHVRRDLSECSFSIHLIGSSYGEIPEGTERSVLDIQNQLAAEKAKQVNNKREFARLIWIAQNLRNASEQQKAFIELLKRDVDAQEGAEILQTPLEDFKNIMREELVGAHDTPEAPRGKSVYLVHDRVDHEEIGVVRDLIQKSGFTVLEPAFEGDLLDVRRRHIENLRNFDAAVIYKGKVNEQWVRMKVLDLLKAPGFGRSKPIQGRALFTAPGTTMNTEPYKNQNITLIGGEGSKPMDTLKTFLQDVNA
jgi:hypothetical protein